MKSWQTASILVLFLSPALAAPDPSWNRLPATATCSQMRERAHAALGGTAAAKPARAAAGSEDVKLAVREIEAGDAACGAGNILIAHAHYVHAFEDLAEPR